MKPYYEHAGITIYHGDCREVLPLLGRADLLFADPPYGVNKAHWDIEFDLKWMEAATKVAPIVAITPGICNLVRMPQRVNGSSYTWCLAAHLINGFARGALGFGNWIPCMVYVADGFSAYQQDGDCRDVIIGEDMKPDHPSPKPYKAVIWFLKRLGGGLVIDPFSGSGTTLLAAKELQREAIGIEIEEKYCEIAAKRLSQEVFEF